MGITTVANTLNHYFFGLRFSMHPIAFTVPGTGWRVFWYGIIITVGFVLGVIYGLKKAKKLGVDPDKLMDCILVTSLLALVGARAYYILFSPEMGFSEFFRVHEGGMAILGAVIMAGLAGALMARIRKNNVLSTLDLAAMGLLIGQSIGRWGNFVNQEAFGSLTGSSWFGISGDLIAEQMGTTNPVHPAFLYESLWCALGFVLLHFIFIKKRRFEGQIACSYIAWYGFGRFFIEALRVDQLTIGESGIPISMLLSGLMFIAGAILLTVGFKVAKATGKVVPYPAVFEEPAAEKDGKKTADEEEVKSAESSSEEDADEGAAVTEEVEKEAKDTAEKEEVEEESDGEDD